MSEIRFDGRVAIITGAGGGLGRGYALDLARRGARVVVNDIGTSRDGKGLSQAAADETVAQIIAAGGVAIASYESAAARAGGESIVSQAMDAFGRVDILINNAGILRNAPFEELSDEELDTVVESHLKAAFYVTQPAYRLMKRQSYGRIIFVSSGSGVFGNPWQANYGAAKTGLIGLMNVVGLEGAAHGVLANTLLPFATTRGGSAYPEEFLAAAEAIMPALRGNAGAEFVTPMVTFLASEACKTTQGIYSAVSGRFAVVFIGVTNGWLSPRGKPVTAEDIAAQLPAISRREPYTVPSSVLAELSSVSDAIKRSVTTGEF